MLARIYLKLELFLLQSIDQSCIVFILRVRPKLKSFKNAVSQCENIILWLWIAKKKDPSKSWKQQKNDKPLLPTHSQIQGLSQMSWRMNSIWILESLCTLWFQTALFCQLHFQAAKDKNNRHSKLGFGILPTIWLDKLVFFQVFIQSFVVITSNSSA